MPAIEDSGPEVAAILNGAGFQIPTDAQFTDFQSAFGWGDHGAAGYLTSAPVASVAGLTGTISGSALLTALGVEAGATADQTGAEIKTAYEAEADTNALTDALLGKLNGIATGATANSGALADLDTVDTAQIDNGAVTIAKLSATGTASSSTYLRGDGTWATVAGGGGGDLLAANNLSDLANAATARTNLGVAIGSDVQAYDANLPTWPATVSAAEVGFLDGVTSGIQAQIDGIAAGGDSWGDVVDADIIPDANNTRDVGSDVARFAQGHFEALNVGGNAVSAIADPAGDAIAFYDNSASSMAYFTALTGLTITGTTLSVDDHPRTTEFLVFNAAESVAVGDVAGDQFLVVPPEWDGKVITELQTNNFTAGVTGTQTVQVRNVTDSVDVLSTPITTDDGEISSRTAATPPVINAANRTLTTGDILVADVDGVHSGTAAVGLAIIITVDDP